MLDLVNPVGAGRKLLGWGRQAGFNEARPVGGKPLTHTLDQHAANLGGRGQEFAVEPHSAFLRRMESFLFDRRALQ